jgi:hypothetical protein
VLENAKPAEFAKAAEDQNVYTCGTIGKHNVLLTHLPAGPGSVAAVIRAAKKTFPQLKQVLRAAVVLSCFLKSCSEWSPFCP